MNRCLVILVGVIFAHPVSAQMFENHEQITLFGNRINDAVNVRVDQTGKTFVFYAENKSYYPYEFEISFTKMINLTPRTAGEKRVLKHGITRILKLTIENEEDDSDYAYTIKYSMGDPSKHADENHPYLIPLVPGKKFEAHTTEQDGVRHFYFNTFKTQAGDTIVAMRKGFVASLPQGNEQTDQLDKDALEIIHEDGSIALYKNVDKSLVKYSQEVFPGQPIGTAGSTAYVSAYVYYLADTRVKPVAMQFAVDETTTHEFKDITQGSTVHHPATVIEKELSPKEIKKLKKSKD